MNIIPPWLKDIDIKINANNIDERDHTNEKLKLVLAKIESIEETFKTRADSHETMLTELELKVNTFSIYFEQLLHSLKDGLHKVFFRIGSDMKQLFTKTSSCNSQRSNQTIPHNIHIQEDHVPDHPLSANSVTKVSRTVANPECSSASLVQNEYSRNSCDSIPETENELNSHMKNAHSSQDNSNPNYTTEFEASTTATRDLPLSCTVCAKVL